MNAASPGVISAFQVNQYYPSHEAYVADLAEAMRHEYETIVAEGLTLQLDCPDLATARHTGFQDLSDEEFLAAEANVEALNAATSNIRPEKMRMHVCWGDYEGPHDRDIPLERVDSPADRAVRLDRRVRARDRLDGLRFRDLRGLRQARPRGDAEEAARIASGRGPRGSTAVSASGPSGVDAAELRAIEHDCAALVMRYANGNDAADWDLVARLFAADGRMSRPTAPDDFIEGRDAILAAFRARPARTSPRMSSSTSSRRLRARGVCARALHGVQGADRRLLPRPLRADLGRLAIRGAARLADLCSRDRRACVKAGPGLHMVPGRVIGNNVT